MEHLDFSSHDALLEFAEGYGAADQHSNSYPPSFLQQSHPHGQARQTWPPLGLDTMGGGEMSRRPFNHEHEQQDLYMPTEHSQRQQIPQPHGGPSSSHLSQPMTLHTAPPDLEYANMLRHNWQYHLPHGAQPLQHQQSQQYVQANMPMNMAAYGTPSFGAQLQASPVEYMPVPTANNNYAMNAGMNNTTYMTMAGPMESMSALVYPLSDFPNDGGFTAALNQAALNQHVAESTHSDTLSGSPTGTILEVQSVSDNEWSLISFNTNPNRHSLESFGTVSNPSQNLHIRTSSDTSSDGPHSADLSGSYEEIPPWPLSSPHDFHGSDYLDAQYIQHAHDLPISDHRHNSPSSSLGVSPTVAIHPSAYTSSSSSSDSPTSSEPTSPPHRRRKSPVDNKTTKAVIKKVTQSPRKDAAAEKKVGRRRGPLRPEQRQQAHEIRKLRACLRCKFLKKTCDKGEPCGGCRPSHARLWQVPCTRLDIKDIGYFLKDWTFDYDRHILKHMSVNNITGFSTLERTVYITHGYGHYLPINAREIYVRDEKCFQMDWVEDFHVTESDEPLELAEQTLKLSAGVEGVSPRILSEYLDRHLEHGFESYVDDYYGGTRFITEILKTAHRFYEKEQTPSIRKALKLLLAYNFTMHITMIEGVSEEEQLVGKIKDAESKFCGKNAAPNMMNFQIKCAMSEIWRELQKDMLEELSTLYSSVYSGDKLKNWPTIFILAAILLVIWEEMEFDTHYRGQKDERAINKFCDDMESTPVGVIVGLFQAISTKLPGLQEWDTRKHHQFLGSNAAICDALTEVKGHITMHEEYLRERTKGTTYDRGNFDSLSNKFLSKLVIRAN